MDCEGGGGGDGGISGGEGGCDPSLDSACIPQPGCINPGSNFAPGGGAPGPGCGGPPPPPPPPSSPTCEIGLFYRKAFLNGLPWNHTYLADMCTVNGVSFENLIQADPGPFPKWPNAPRAPKGYLGNPWLVGVIGPIGTGPGDSTSGNFQVGSWESISYADTLRIGCAVLNYDYNFVQPYVLFPWNKTQYNSNSFIYTLDVNYNLGFGSPPGTRRGPFNTTPGWYNPVPQLGPSGACP